MFVVVVDGMGVVRDVHMGTKLLMGVRLHLLLEIISYGWRFRLLETRLCCMEFGVWYNICTPSHRVCPSMPCFWVQVLLG